jgi:hypothetical protein
MSGCCCKDSEAGNGMSDSLTTDEDDRTGSIVGYEGQLRKRGNTYKYVDNLWKLLRWEATWSMFVLPTIFNGRYKLNADYLIREYGRLREIHIGNARHLITEFIRQHIKERTDFMTMSRTRGTDSITSSEWISINRAAAKIYHSILFFYGEMNTIKDVEGNDIFFDPYNVLQLEDVLYG